MKLCDVIVDKMKVEIIVFDFDNVIVRGSEECKKKAWSCLFSEGSSDLKLLKEAQSRFANGRGDRFDILGHVFGVPMDTNPRSDARVIDGAERYNIAVQKCIQKIGITESDLRIIMQLEKKYPLYVISATPEIALHTTLSLLGRLYTIDFLSLFQLVLGTPNDKLENFKKVYEHSKKPFSHMVMIGDGTNDYAAASAMGTQFIGVETPETELAWKIKKFSKVTAIDELPALLG